jgi:hypothetical protein
VTLYPGSSPGFDEHEQCDEARWDSSSTDLRRELVIMRSVTGRDNKGDFCIYGAVDEVKSSPPVGARRKRAHHNLQDRVCHRTLWWTILWEIW